MDNERTAMLEAGRFHKPEVCTLKRPCNTCKEQHLTVVHVLQFNKHRRACSCCSYRSVAHLLTEDVKGEIDVSFLLTRSRVTLKKQLSMPQLEQRAALTGAQPTSVLHNGLTRPIHRIILWSDSTTSLHWIRSESCHNKVFVGTRVAEIQSLSKVSSWRYRDSANNSANDITRGKILQELSKPHCWHLGPHFLSQTKDRWPISPWSHPETDDSELRKSSCCGHVAVDTGPQPPRCKSGSPHGRSLCRQQQGPFTGGPVQTVNHFLGMLTI